jgi:hypothetical protein
MPAGSKTLKSSASALKTGLLACSTCLFFYGFGWGIGVLTDNRRGKPLAERYPFAHEKLGSAFPFHAPALGIAGEHEHALVDGVRARDIAMITKALTHMNAAHQEHFNKAMQYIVQSYFLTRAQTTPPTSDMTIFNLLCERVPAGIDLRKALVAALDNCHVFEVAQICVDKLAEVARAKEVPPVTWKELFAIIKRQNNAVLPALANISRDNKELLDCMFKEIYKKDGLKGIASTRLLIGAPNEGLNFLRSKSTGEFITTFKELILESKTQDTVMLVAMLSAAEREALNNDLQSSLQSNPSDLRLIALTEIFALEGFSTEVNRCAEHLRTHATFQNIELNQIFTEQAIAIIRTLGWAKFFAVNWAAEQEMNQRQSASQPPAPPVLQQMSIVPALPITTRMIVTEPIIQRTLERYYESKSNREAPERRYEEEFNR